MHLSNLDKEAKLIRRVRCKELVLFIWSSIKVQTVDALAVRGDEGRGNLRKA